MNKQLIQEVIKSSNVSCAEIVYQNPLLDRNVAKTLTKSLIAILNVFGQNDNIRENNVSSTRHTVLQNIRNMCKIEPEGHIPVDEKLLDKINEFYCSQIIGPPNAITDVNKKLDDFLLRHLNDFEIKSKYKVTINPETLKALLNLNNSKEVYGKKLLDDLINWDCEEIKFLHIIKEYWKTSDELTEQQCNDISLKIKEVIENNILEICTYVLKNRFIDVKEYCSDNFNFINLCKHSSTSTEAFQICSKILNCIFIQTNFDVMIQNLILVFVESVKLNTKSVFSLYPLHLRNIVVSLHFDVKSLSSKLKDFYLRNVIKSLQSIQCKNELIMLLSHYPDWFDFYFDNES